MKISARPCSETHKYIYVSDLIELISFSSKPNIKIAHVALYLIDANFDKQVTSYFANRGRSYSKDMHRENFGFDINTREYLTHCDDIRYLTSKYFLPNDLEGVEDGFCYLIEEIQSIDCIKDLDIDFGSSAMFKVTEASRKYNDDLNPYIFRLSDTMDFKESNPFRDKLAVLDTYSVMYAACLLSGDSPTEIRKFQSHLEFTQVFSEYISYKLMIELAIKNNELKNNDDKILASDLKEYLGKNGYFFRGFNDWMAIEPAKPLINNKPNEQLEASNNKLKEAQAKIADLKNQLSQAKAELADKPDTIGNDKSLYVTPAIEIMNKVITEFWINYDPNQSAPKQEIIVRWITGNFDGVSKALALNIDKVCRHSEARSGGKYKR